MRCLNSIVIIALCYSVSLDCLPVKEHIQESETVDLELTGKLWADVCEQYTDIFVSASSGKDYKGWGASVDKPYKTIDYAVKKSSPCQRINVMAGRYTNKGFGSGKNNKNVVASLNGVENLIIKNYEDHRPVVEFDGPGGFVGGSKTKPVVNLEIYGFEIVGPNANISFEEAMANRLKGKPYYTGRGVAIWEGHHIHIHDMLVHHCPASGIRVNNADYVVVENSEVYSNTWWSPAAESAIVFATSKHIDEEDKIKMAIRGCKVYDNLNKIPYYNEKYTWDYSPIGSAKCGDYPECERGEMSCPWTCRYGKATQDYIIDGQGVYVTRNKDTYLYGQMELSGNTCYGNGINGLVFHRTDRGLVKRNAVYGNGVVPKAGHPEPVPEDWHKGCSGKTRQPYSGLVLNNAEGVRLWGNVVSARYEDDFAYTMEMDHGAHKPTVKGGNNAVCQGKVDINPMSVVRKAKEGECAFH